MFNFDIFIFDRQSETFANLLKQVIISFERKTGHNETLKCIFGLIKDEVIS